MFRDNINKPIDPIPAGYVDSLSCLDNEPDYSLRCLGIAMLKHRIENYSGISGVWHHFDSESTCFTDVRMRYDCLNENVPTLCYYSYSYDLMPNDDEKDKFEEMGMKIKDNIGTLISQKSNIRCTVAYHPEKNFAVVLINTRDIRYYHLLISFLSLMFPNLFKDKPLEEKDYNLIKSLSKNDKDTFIKRIQECVAPYALEFRRLMLSNLMRTMHEAKIQNAMRDVENQRRTVNDIEQSYSEAIRTLKNLIVVFEGMKATENLDSPEEELIEYLAKNRNIHNLNIMGSKLQFTVATLLNNFNEDAWNTFDRKGYIYDGRYQSNLLDVFNTENNRRTLLNAIFSDKAEFAVKVAGNYTMDLFDCNLRTNSNYDYNNADPLFKSYLPNPHLAMYACLGGYKERVMKALRDRKYIVAVELCCASAGSVNVEETEQTFRPFLGWIMSSREKILRRKDGVEMTPEEALIYLIDKENANETN